MGNLVKRSQLKAKTSLKAKTPLAKVSPTKKPKKRLKLEEKNAQQLVSIADKVFSKYIRLRDSTRHPDGSRRGLCISCDRILIVQNPDGTFNGNAQNGHYVGRGNHELRFDEYNCNLQCAHCNAWRDKIAMLNGYAEGIDLKYGDGVSKQLQLCPVRYSSKKPELLAVIHTYTAQIEQYLLT